MPYNNCPKCGTKYTSKQIYSTDINQDFLKCQNCDFIFYNNPKPAVVGLIYNDNNEILLVKRSIKPYSGYWDLPGGFIATGENASQAIIREIKEELDLDAVTLNIKTTFVEKYNNKGKDDELYNLLIIIYNLGIKSFKEISPKDDISDYKFFSLKNLPQKIAFPEKEIFLKKLAKKAKFNLKLSF